LLPKLQVASPFPAAYGQEESSLSYAEQRRLEDARLQDAAPTPPEAACEDSKPGCGCCESGLYDEPGVEPYETICGGCDHVVARHNVMVPAHVLPPNRRSTLERRG
jgi:hypothetical protein